MKKLLMSVLVAALLCSPAWADLTAGDRTGAPIITASNPVPLGEVGGERGPFAYDSLYAGVAGYWAYPPASGPIGFDDYDFTPGVSSVGISQLKFVGGVTAVNQVLWFDFYSAGGSYVGSLGGMFPHSGYWIWTLTIGAAPYWIPHTGIMQIFANTTTTYYGVANGAWFFTSADALIVGSNNTTFGPPVITTATYGMTYLSVHDFAFVCTPEPGTPALLGAGVLFLVRRR
jgi:hypothetical protein